ncbi:hypothetical protein STRDD10_01498 [Streptococcus sp. DD10]|nr:hypothetical protein STRDD10_01498 [Streptococcus sp. DD10]
MDKIRQLEEETFLRCYEWNDYRDICSLGSEAIGVKFEGWNGTL